MLVQNYLFFEGRCDEAIEFYKRAVGAEVQMLMRFKDNPDPQSKAGCAPGTDDKVMHANIKFGDTQIMMSDGRCEGTPKFAGFSLTLNAASPAEADKLFAAISEGGQVQMPLCETFFAHRFGMAADKFGVSWMVIAEKK